ncbi:hypothetical protein ACHAXN_010521, partial [Cyclotella atomus]
MKRTHPTMNTTSSKSPATKRVRFADTATLIILERQQELKEHWLSRREMKQHKQNMDEAAKTIRRTPLAKAYILQSVAVDGEDVKHLPDHTEQLAELCGIEHLLSSEVCRALLTSKCLASQRVLQEQARQQKMGDHDNAKIAEASINASLFSRLWHYRIASG